MEQFSIKFELTKDSVGKAIDALAAIYNIFEEEIVDTAPEDSGKDGGPVNVDLGADEKGLAGDVTFPAGNVNQGIDIPTPDLVPDI